MIGKINSTAFRGTISVVAGQRARNGYKAYIFEKERVFLDTEKIKSIDQKRGYTRIEYNQNSEEYHPFYFVPSDITTTYDILAAYSAAKNSNLQVVLEDKSEKNII